MVNNKIKNKNNKNSSNSLVFGLWPMAADKKWKKPEAQTLIKKTFMVVCWRPAFIKVKYDTTVIQNNNQLWK